MKAQAEAIVASLARTFVPALVGGLFTWLASTGLEVDPQLEGLITVAMFGLFTGMYYAAVRFVETKLPWVGILIGYAKSPDTYSKGNLEATAVVNVNPAPSPTVNVYASPGSSVTEAVSEAIDIVESLDRKPGPDHLADK